MGTLTTNQPLRTTDQNLVSEQTYKSQESVKTGRSATQNTVFLYATAATNESLRRREIGNNDVTES